MLSLTQIQCFVMTVDHGSVTAAARALGVSPQAVSKSVNDLERTLGRSLFVRRATGLKPTPYGLTFCKKARHMLREARELEDFSNGASVANRDHVLLLLCIPKVANFLSISYKISTFLTSRLGVPAEIDYSSCDDCLERLSFGEADAFITIGRTLLPEQDVKVIDSIDVGALMVEGHPLAGKRALTLEDVVGHPLYLTRDFPFFNDTVIDELQRSARAEDLRLLRMTMSLHGLFNAIVTKRGCIVMPTIQGIDDWLPSTTTVPFEAREVGRVPLCLVTPREGKTDFGAAIEDLLVPSRGKSAPVSRMALGHTAR